MRPIATVLGDHGANDIFKATGFDGDDAFELIEEFAEQFGVNFDTYFWDFHQSDEGGLMASSWPFKSPDQKVSRVPISIDMLVEAARAGEWTQQYPDHVPDRWRLDIWNFPIILGMYVIAFTVFVLITGP